MAKQLGSIYKTVKDYSGTVVNTSIVAVTGGIEQLTTLAAYNCPCVSVSQLGPGCANSTTNIGTSACAQKLNIKYGLTFIIVPAIALYVFGITSSPRTWKLLTGCTNETQQYKRELPEIMWTCFSILGQALLSPLAWVSMAFLDGRYLACSLTPLPYDIASSNPTFRDCEAVAASRVMFYSDAFNANRTFSQVIGWILIAVLVTFGFILYAVAQCTFPLTYYHAKYYKLYRQAEEQEFDQEMEKKARREAEDNVLAFMEKRRGKPVWDRISSVFEFHRDKKKLALYSPLHEWVLEEKVKELERLSLNQPTEVISLNGIGEDLPKIIDV